MNRISIPEKKMYNRLNAEISTHAVEICLFVRLGFMAYQPL